MLYYLFLFFNVIIGVGDTEVGVPLLFAEGKPLAIYRYLL